VTQYIIRRLLLLVPVILIVGVVVFTLVHLTPGDPAAVILGPDATSEQVERLREQLGLNEPFYIQFVDWMAGVVRGDLGTSLYLNMPVTEALLDRAQPTFTLMLYSLTISILIGVPVGIFSAIKPNSVFDRFAMIGAISGVAIPNFVLGILLIMIFAVWLRFLPSQGYVGLFTDPIGHFERMLMPSFSLGFSSAALLARMVRSSMLDVLKEDYVRTALAKGVAFRNVITRHALRNALIPAVTVIGYSVGALLGGAVVTETVFGLPGMGRLVVNSIGRRDYPVIQGAVMLIAVFYVMANLLVDILYVYIDPRIRYGDD
jgi:peptide/nickel transport system permease protein